MQTWHSAAGEALQAYAHHGRVVEDPKPAWHPQPLQVEAARTVRHLRNTMVFVGKMDIYNGQLVERERQLNRYRKELSNTQAADAVGRKLLALASRVSSGI